MAKHPPIPDLSMADGKAHPEEVRFLSGPQERGYELARALRIFFEFIRGFRKLHFVGPGVTVFGSARFGEGHAYYDMARQTGAHLARAGFTVITGGGPGIMEAANRGAKEAGGHSVGCNIVLPHEQNPNPYVDVMVTFRYFFVRKVMLVKYSYAFVALPGGFGTYDEIFEAATLIQTGKIKHFPIILIGRAYWQPLIDVLRNTLLAQGAIDQHDVDSLQITDSPEEAAEIIRTVAIEEFGLKYATEKRKRRRFLFE